MEGGEVCHVVHLVEMKGAIFHRIYTTVGAWIDHITVQ